MPLTPDRTLWSLLGERADEQPDAVLVGGGAPVSYAEMRLRAGRVAAGLLELDVRRGDHVLVQAGNRVEHLELLLGLNAIGAVYCPVSPELRGASLRHAIDLVGPSVAVLDAPSAQRWAADAGGSPCPRLLLDAEESLSTGDTRYLDACSGVPSAVDAVHDPGLPAMVLMTSGTTGRSKGVVLSSRFALSVAAVNVRERAIGAADRLHTSYSFSHTNPHCFTFLPALVAGAGFSWSPRFSVSGFWSQLREAGATQFSLFTAPMQMLLQAEPTEADRSHGASVCFSIGTPRGRGQEFEDRFGVQIVEAYGMTECGAITFRPHGTGRLESAGRPVAEWEVRVADARGEPAGPGAVGEILARPRRPGLLMEGYLDDAAATLAAFRDLWFHTGDTGYFDADGELWYIGRGSDVIRYRGENVSALDVETTVRATGLVEDVAAVALDAELGEDDLLLVVVPARDALAPDQLYDALVEDLPRYCLPRHIRLVPQLPRTETGRVIKGVLREQGVTAETWTAPRRGPA